MITIFYEDLFGPENPHQQRRFNYFLGIDFEPGDAQKISRSGLSLELNLDTRLKVINKLRDIYSYIRDRYNGDIPESWEKDLTSVRGA